MQGKRVYIEPHLYEQGDYGKWKGIWYCCPPCFQGLGNLANHNVIEHEDGTISVSPSILITMPNIGTWHGYLTKGIWAEC